jgi:hypothetical protein
MNKTALLMRTDGTTERLTFTVDGEYETLSRGVGGYIQAVTLAEGLVMWVNEEGKLNGLPHNPVATRWFSNIFGEGRDVIVGDAVFTGGTDDEGYMNSLTETQLASLEAGSKAIVALASV